MLTRINKHRDEAGFTLIELLVVVIIIGILAAIAIPVFLNQRNAARSAAVESDVRNLAIQVETYYTQNQAYPTTQAELDAATTDTKLSNGVVISYTPDSTTGYVLAGCNTQAGESAFDDTYAEYNSATGGIVDAADVAGTACPGGAAETVTLSATGTGTGDGTGDGTT